MQIDLVRQQQPITDMVVITVLVVSHGASKSIHELQQTVIDCQAKRLQFRAWRKHGEVIDTEFTMVAG